MQPSKLSEILRKTCGLGEGMAVEVSKKLRLSEVETQHFVTLVEAEHARSQFKREQARSLLKRFSQVYGYSELDLERFKIISDWYHLAFLELIEVEDFQCDFDWVARRLGISRPLVENAFQRLIEFGLMKIEASLKK